MYRLAFRSSLTASALLLAALAAPAQSAPKMKAGLWEIHMEQQRNGQKIPDASERMREHMKSMPPERRKEFEETMKRRGIDTSAGGTLKICYSQKMVDHGAWADQGSCKTTFTDRSATSWKWHSICQELGYEGEGDARFPDSENFVVRSSGVTTSGAETLKVSSTKTGKWLRADCGDVKPMDTTP